MNRYKGDKSQSLIRGMERHDHGLLALHSVHKFECFQKSNLHGCLHVQNICSLPVEFGAFKICFGRNYLALDQSLGHGNLAEVTL